MVVELEGVIEAERMLMMYSGIEEASANNYALSNPVRSVGYAENPIWRK